MKNRIMFILLLFVATLSIMFCSCGSEPIVIKEDVVFVVGHVEGVTDGFYKYTANECDRSAFQNTPTHDGPSVLYIHKDIIKYDIGDTIRIEFKEKKQPTVVDY